MDITDATPDRTQIAMERFSRGADCLEFHGVSFRILAGGEVEVAAISQWQPQNITEQTARADLLRGRQILEHLTTASPEFQRAVVTRRHRCCVIDDYGKGSVEICRVDGDRLVWASGFTPST